MSTTIDLPECVFIGAAIRFFYPLDNRLGAKTKLTPRRVVVREIQDCDEKPVPQWCINERPTVRRGRWLIHAYDLDRHSLRRYYLRSIRELKPYTEPLYQIGMFDPCADDEPIEYLESVWTNSHLDQWSLRKIIAAYNDWAETEEESTLAMGVFPYDQEAFHA